MSHPRVVHLLRGAAFLLAGASLFAMAPTAMATGVSASAVTSPATEQHVLDNNGSSPTLAFSGTSNGQAGDFVDLVCYDNGTTTHVLSSHLAVAAGGSWSAPTVNMAAVDGDLCSVRAVPNGVAYPSGAALSAFSSLTVGVTDFSLSTLASGPSMGQMFDFEANDPQDAATNDEFSLGDCGSCDSALFNPDGSLGGYVWYYNDVIWYNGSGIDLPGLFVDGTPAVTAYEYKESHITVPGYLPITATASIDQATGNLAVATVEPLTACSPSVASCTSMVSLNVALHRTITTSASGRIQTIVDSWVSTNGAAHTLKMDLDDDFYSAAAAPQWELPGQTTFAAHVQGDIVTVPSGASSILFERDGSVPDGSIAQPTASLSWSEAPDQMSFFNINGGDHNVESTYTRTIPATGSWDLTRVYEMAASLATTKSEARATEDKLAAPAVSIASSANGATVNAATVTVSGTASDNVGLASFTVDGAAVTVGAGGAWSTAVPLSLGANTITAIGADAAGNHTSATATVIYKDTTPPTIVVKALKLLVRATTLAHGFVATLMVGEACTATASATVSWATALKLHLAKTPKKKHAKHPANVSVAAGSGRLGVGRGSITLHFTKAAKSKLASVAGAEKLKVVVIAKDASGNVTTKTFTVTLATPKVSRKKHH